MPRSTSYRFNITWLHTAGRDPDRPYVDQVTAIGVQQAIARLLGDINEAGYDRKDVLIIDARNIDIT